MAASLPSDIIDLISKKVKLDADYVRFRSVCKSWRSIAPKRCAIFLIRHPSGNFMIETKFFNIISFETNEILAVRGPSKSSSPSSILNNDEVVCIGSSLGWMALIHPLTKWVFLYNPITNCIVDLPDFPKCSVHLTNRVCYERIDFIMSSDPVVSPADCVVLIMNDCSEKIIYCVIGNNSKTWNQFSFPIFYDSSIQHLRNQWGKRACFSNGNLYLTIMGKLVKSSNKLDAECKPHGLEVSFDYHLNEELSNNDESYVVENDGDVLIVLVNWPQRRTKEGYNFRLYKLFKERRNTPYGEKMVDNLEKVECLGDKAIFLSHKTSFCVTASDYFGCKENCVYYVARYGVGKKTTMKMRVHDLTDHSDVVLKDNVPTLRREWALCSWFAPSLQP